MPLRYRRTTTKFGKLIHSPLGAKRSGLLITRGGERLLLNYREMLRSVKVRVKNGHDIVEFAKGIHPKPIGSGEHAKLFLLSAAEETPFKTRREKQTMRLPKVALKVYRKSVSEKNRPDGFTQFVANTAIYNYLKARPELPFIVRPLQYYFVSSGITARKFIHAPTFIEVWETMSGSRIRDGPLSLTMTESAIRNFATGMRLTVKELQRVDTAMEKALVKGQKHNFGANPKIPIELDIHWGNSFVLGRDKSTRKPIIAIIDQAKHTARGAGELIRKGQAL